MANQTPGYWLADPETPHKITILEVERELFRKTSRFQEIRLVKTVQFGRCLILDNKIQSAEGDEYIYHEALVHPSMILHNDPRKALILGGGEGSTLREVLKHKSVEEAVMVDIDSDMIDLARKWMESWHKGSFDDRRSRVIIEDARDYLEEHTDRFDIIISDLSEPVEDGISSPLFTEEFFCIIRERLNPGGIFALQALDVFFHGNQTHVLIHKSLKKLFPRVFSYIQFIPSFSSLWGFIIAGEDLPCRMPSVEEVDVRISERLPGVDLKYYDGETHAHIFCLPKNLRMQLDEPQKM